MFLLNGYGTIPLLRSLNRCSVQGGTVCDRVHDRVHDCVNILSQSTFLATKALADTRCLHLCPQTRANLLAMLSCLLVDLEPLRMFPAAEFLRANLVSLQTQLKEISTPAKTTAHAVLYRILSGVNQRTSQLMLGDVSCFDELTLLVTCATQALAGIELTPTIRVIVRGLMCTLRKHQSLPRPLAKSLTSLSQCLRQKRVKLQICS